MGPIHVKCVKIAIIIFILESMGLHGEIFLEIKDLSGPFYLER